MRQLARIALRSGIVSPDMTAEFAKWGFYFNSDDLSSVPAPKTKEQFIEQVEQALEAEDLVIVRETDLSVLDQYLSTQKVGSLVVIDNGTPVKFDITYGMAKTGEYIIAWRGDSISELLTNGLTFLLEKDDNQVFFSNVRELFFGETKSFIVCAPAKAKVKEEA